MTFAGTVPGILGTTINDASRLPDFLPGATQVDPWTIAAPGSLLFSVPGVARYLVSAGAVIEVEAVADADRSSVELFLYGSARGSLIHQRGELPLEAATLMAPNGVAVAISSYSGIGKSTVAAELCRRGWSLIADDITRLTWTGGRVVAWPSHNALKLWRDACERMATDVQSLPRARAGMEKFYVKVPAASAPAMLQTIVRLRLGSRLRTADVPVNHRMSLLSECAFRRRQITALGQQDSYERILQQVARTCRIVIVSGARGVHIDSLVDHIAKAVS
jgi:hypothetical protein